MANIYTLPFKKFVWGSTGEFGGIEIHWIRFNISEEDVNNPLSAAMQVRDDYLDVLNQIRLAREAKEFREAEAKEKQTQEQLCLPNPESEPK